MGLQTYELEQQSIEALPQRELMALVNANLAIPINAALALNLLSDSSTAVAGAIQSGDIGQSI